MKKLFMLVLLCFILSFATLGTVMAQGVEAEIQKLTEDLQNGKVDMATFQKRLLELQQKVMQEQLTPDQKKQLDAAGQQQVQKQASEQQPNFPPEGYTAGWPSSSVFSQWNWPSLRQPAGSTTAYSSGNYGIGIIIKGGSQANFDQIGKELDSASPRNQSYKESGFYSRSLPKPSGVMEDEYGVQMRLENGDMVVETFRRSR